MYITVMHYRIQATRQPRQFTYDPVPIPHMLSQSGKINWFQLHYEIKRGIEVGELKGLRNREGLCRDGKVYR